MSSDYIKQSNKIADQNYKDALAYAGSWMHAIRSISFWLQGIEPRVLWIGFGGSIFFGVLEKTKSILAERNSHRDSKLKP